MKTINFIIILLLNFSPILIAGAKNDQRSENLKKTKISSSYNIGDSIITTKLKSKGVNFFLLDSFIYYRFSSLQDSTIYSKNIYYYDSDTDLLENSYYCLENPNLNFKTKYTYYNNSNIINSFQYDWDTATNKWVDFVKNEYYYDSKGLDTLKLLLYWDKDSIQYKIDNKDIYTYYENGNLKTEIHSYWYLDECNPASKKEYFYNANNQCISNLIYYWDSQNKDWRISNKIEWSFDSNGKDTLYAYYDWNNTLQEWYGNNKHSNKYNSDQQITNQIFFKWDRNANNWIINGKSEYKYNSSGNKTLWEEYLWDINANDWNGYRKYEYDYYIDFKLKSETKFSWNSVSKSWNLDLKELNIYDKNGNLIRLENYSFYQSSEEWKLYAKAFLFYQSKNIVNIPFISEKEMFIYPNPTNGYLIINETEKFKIIEVYNLKGQKVIDQKIINYINISNLENGIYIVKLITKEYGNFIQKIILKK